MSSIFITFALYTVSHTTCILSRYVTLLTFRAQVHNAAPAQHVYTHKFNTNIVAVVAVERVVRETEVSAERWSAGLLSLVCVTPASSSGPSKERLVAIRRGALWEAASPASEHLKLQVSGGGYKLQRLSCSCWLDAQLYDRTTSHTTCCIRQILFNVYH